MHQTLIFGQDVASNAGTGTLDVASNAGTGMGAVNYLGSSRDSAPRVGRLRKISVHFLSLS